jgi:hypothetical protein
MTPKHTGINLWMSRRKDLFFYPREDWQALCDQLQKNRPSTGAMILDFVANRLHPTQLNLFGFDFKKSKTLYEKKQKLGPHNWELEQACALQRIEEARAQNLDWNIY